MPVLGTHPDLTKFTGKGVTVGSQKDYRAWGGKANSALSSTRCAAEVWVDELLVFHGARDC